MLAALSIPTSATHDHPLAIWAPAIYFPANITPIKKAKPVGKAHQTTSTTSSKKKSLLEILDNTDFEVSQHIPHALKLAPLNKNYTRDIIDLTLPEQAESSAMGASRMSRDDYSGNFIDLTLPSVGSSIMDASYSSLSIEEEQADSDIIVISE